MCLNAAEKQIQCVFFLILIKSIHSFCLYSYMRYSKLLLFFKFCLCIWILKTAEFVSSLASWLIFRKRNNSIKISSLYSLCYNNSWFDVYKRRTPLRADHDGTVDMYGARVGFTVSLQVPPDDCRSLKVGQMFVSVFLLEDLKISMDKLKHIQVNAF